MNNSFNDEKDQIVSKMVDALNSAFEADPAAIHALISNRIPCNPGLLDHPHVAVMRVDTLPGKNCAIGVMGLLSGCLNAAGLPNIVSRWSEPDGAGRRQLLGFIKEPVFKE